MNWGAVRCGDWEGPFGGTLAVWALICPGLVCVNDAEHGEETEGNEFGGVCGKPMGCQNLTRSFCSSCFDVNLHCEFCFDFFRRIRVYVQFKGKIRIIQKGLESRHCLMMLTNLHLEYSRYFYLVRALNFRSRYLFTFRCLLVPPLCTLLKVQLCDSLACESGPSLNTVRYWMLDWSIFCSFLALYQTILFLRFEGSKRWRRLAELV
jgi:hypothetical protein